MKIEVEKEFDGRWIAEIPELPGVMAYGDSKKEAVAKSEALALRIIAHKGRKVWDAPGVKATEADFKSALGRPRKDRDQWASGL